MNILYIAYSCSPFDGSEDKIGWSVPFESAKTNRVFVITKEEQREKIERYCADHSANGIQFFYVDIPASCKRIFTGFLYSGRLNVWNRRAMKVAREICAREKIDVIHQIAPVEFRSIGDYGRIPGVKFVCGPIAGGQMIPKALEAYTGTGIRVERIRKWVNGWYRCGLRWSGKLKYCDYLLFANEETKTYLYGKSNPQGGWQVLTDVSVDSNGLIDPSEIKAGKNGKCVFLVAGRLVYLKGHALLLDALARIPAELDYECRIVGAGPELENLRNRCREYALEDKVIFMGEIPHTEMGAVYAAADVLVMPSFREATGSVLLEAMSKGLPVVTINRFGGAAIVDEAAGWLYDADTMEEFVGSLKDILVFCITHPNEVARRGIHARDLAARYTWEERLKFYQSVYESLSE